MFIFWNEISYTLQGVARYLMRVELYVLPRDGQQYITTRSSTYSEMSLTRGTNNELPRCPQIYVFQHLLHRGQGEHLLRQVSHKSPKLLRPGAGLDLDLHLVLLPCRVGLLPVQPADAVRVHLHVKVPYHPRQDRLGLGVRQAGEIRVSIVALNGVDRERGLGTRTRLTSCRCNSWAQKRRDLKRKKKSSQHCSSSRRRQRSPRDKRNSRKQPRLSPSNLGSPSHLSGRNSSGSRKFSSDRCVDT